MNCQCFVISLFIFDVHNFMASGNNDTAMHVIEMITFSYCMPICVVLKNSKCFIPFIL